MQFLEIEVYHLMLNHKPNVMTEGTEGTHICGNYRDNGLTGHPFESESHSLHEKNWKT